MEIKEIRLEELDERQFVEDKVNEISYTVGNDLAVNALSGGVDSPVVTILAHRALGNRLKSYFIENGLMREGEPEQVVSLFEKLGVEVELIDVKKEFFNALKGVVDPEEKREAITQTFHKTVFVKITRDNRIKYLF